MESTTPRSIGLLNSGPSSGRSYFGPSLVERFTTYAGLPTSPLRVLFPPWSRLEVRSMNFDDLYDLANDRPNDRLELSSPDVHPRTRNSTLMEGKRD